MASPFLKPLQPGDNTVIIGAGPAGLTAGYLLSQRGHAVTVLEADHQVGGLSRTEQYKGYRFDIGGHRFFTKIPDVQALWEDLLGDELLVVPRLSRIHYRGKYFAYPLKPWNALRGLGPVNAVRIIASYLYAHYRPFPFEETFEQWVINRFGRRMYEVFFKTYTEKVWGIPCREIRAEWAAQRIQGLSLARAILSATALNRRAGQIKSLIEAFQYPRLGPGQMWESARDRIEALENQVLLGHRVVSLEWNVGTDGHNQITRVWVDSPQGRVSFPSDHLISSMPLSSLVRAIEPAAPPSVVDAADGLRYRDLIVVALILNGSELFPDNWIYVHTPGVKVGRIQNFNNWSRDMVPTPGMTCLGMEYFCFESDGLWTSSDADLVALASKELAALGLADPARIRDGCVVRMPKAYPVYDSTYAEHLTVLRGFIDPIPNLHTVGRNGMHKYNNQDHSMLTGVYAARNVTGEQYDVWSVNTEKDYLEESESVEENAANDEALKHVFALPLKPEPAPVAKPTLTLHQMRMPPHP